MKELLPDQHEESTASELAANREREADPERELIPREWWEQHIKTVAAGIALSLAAAAPGAARGQEFVAYEAEAPAKGKIEASGDAVVQKQRKEIEAWKAILRN